MIKVCRFSVPIILALLMTTMLIYMVQVSNRALGAGPQADLVVTTLLDSSNPDGLCSLREAIEAANTNSLVPDCGTGDVITDTITFNVAGVITVTSQLEVGPGGPLGIYAGDAITTSGNGTTRVWQIDPGSRVTLSHIAVTDGESIQGGGLDNNSGDVTIIASTFFGNNGAEGGGIYNLGSLEISDSSFFQNHASAVDGAIRNFGTLTITNTNFSENSSTWGGGAIGDFGTMSIIDCTFINNTGSTGGALSSGGPLVISHSTFIGNTAGSGGGVAIGNAIVMDSTFAGNVASSAGGGIYISHVVDRMTTILNSTVSGNTADHGGGVYIQGKAILTNSTISGNNANITGGGLFTAYDGYDPSYLYLSHSTVAGNSAIEGGGIYNVTNTSLFSTIIGNNLSGGDCLVHLGTITDAGHNLDSDDSCGLDPANGSLPATNPMLGPLQDNGGPTFTQALLPASPAIDAGDADQCIETDQRGMHRPIDGNIDGTCVCDIGSFEAGGAFLIVTTLDAVVNNDGYCSLPEAVEAANTNNPVDTCGAGNNLFDMILFNVSGTIDLDNELDITASGWLMIEGQEAIQINGSSSVRGLHTESGSELILDRLTIVDGYTINNGAGLFNDSGDVTILNSTFSGNAASEGGGIYNTGLLTILKSTFSGNEATSNGGAVFNHIGILSIVNSTFSVNSSGTSGGSIYNEDVVDITNGTLSGNTSPAGGGLFAASGTATLINTIVADSPCGFGAGFIIDAGHNLDTGDSCGFEVGNGSLPGTDPLLGGLQDNGGPTFTHALLPDSPAVDAGDNNQCPATDQRGHPRPVDGNGDWNPTCDMGAYEDNYGYLLVSTLVDEINNDGYCSLREALQAANFNKLVNDCGQGGNNTDTILFSVAGTITVTHQLEVMPGGPLVIDGGEVITTSGGDTTRVWWVGEGSSLTIKNFAITDGYYYSKDGGGLYNDGGMVNIINANFLNNRTYYSSGGGFGGGIYNSGSITVTSSIFSENLGNGGGIYNNGMLSVTDSIFSENIAEGAVGGGIDNEGYAIILNTSLINNYGYVCGGVGNDGYMVLSGSTISGNSSSWGGGGLCNYGDLDLINSTLSNNHSEWGTGGGIYTSDAFTVTLTTITNSTIFSNSATSGSGIAAGGAVSLANTIVAGNHTVTVCEGTITDLGHNLDSDNTCGLDPVNGSIPGVDPLLGTLQDNGGPTWTHALLPDSPAIDAGDNIQCPEIDQRGVFRPQDGNGDGIAICDIGSYELEGPYVSPTLVTINGTGEGLVNNTYTFTATVEPFSTTLPLEYVWQASGQDSITHTGGLSDTIDYDWQMTGTKVITVTASNLVGQVMDTHIITIALPIEFNYLPLVIIFR